MKRYNEMEESELLSLTDDQVSLLIDYECAVEGVPMLPPAPGPEPSKDFPEPDMTVFAVGGVLTTDSERAGRILAAMTDGAIFTSTHHSNMYGHYYLKQLGSKDYNYPKVETQKVHSPEQWDRISKDIATFSTRKAEWDRISKEYKDALEERQGIIDAVWEAIRDARDRAYTRDNLRAEFSRYLELAEGNNGIAYNFLDKAKGHILADFPELREEFCPPTCADEPATPLTDLRAEDVGEVVL